MNRKIFVKNFKDNTEEVAEVSCAAEHGSALICMTFALSFIANGGFSIWSALWEGVNNISGPYGSVMRAALIFDVLGTVFMGLSALCILRNFLGKKLVSEKNYF